MTNEAKKGSRALEQIIEREDLSGEQIFIIAASSPLYDSKILAKKLQAHLSKLTVPILILLNGQYKGGSRLLRLAIAMELKKRWENLSPHYLIRLARKYKQERVWITIIFLDHMKQWLKTRQPSYLYKLGEEINCYKAWNLILTTNRLSFEQRVRAIRNTDDNVERSSMLRFVMDEIGTRHEKLTTGQFRQLKMALENVDYSDGWKYAIDYRLLSVRQLLLVNHWTNNQFLDRIMEAAGLEKNIFPRQLLYLAAKKLPGLVREVVGIIATGKLSKTQIRKIYEEACETNSVKIKKACVESHKLTITILSMANEEIFTELAEEILTGHYQNQLKRAGMKTLAELADRLFTDEEFNEAAMVVNSFLIPRLKNKSLDWLMKFGKKHNWMAVGPHLEEHFKNFSKDELIKIGCQIDDENVWAAINNTLLNRQTSKAD